VEARLLRSEARCESSGRQERRTAGVAEGGLAGAADGGWRRAGISGNSGAAARGGGTESSDPEQWLSRHTSEVLAIQPLVWYIWVKEREI